MKTIIPLRSPRQHGSVLVVGLIIATILGVTLASYLVLTVSQQRSVVRSQTWTASLALSESGVEEALAFMNKYSGSFADLTKWTNNPGAEGWDVAGNVYHVKRTVDSVVGSYDVYVTNLVSGPMIYSIGSATWQFASAPAGQPFFAAAGVGGVNVSSNSLSSSTAVARRVLVRAVNSPLFAVAMAALGQIDLKGNNIATDSFDSADTNYSNGGLYPTGNLNKTKANGSVVTDSTLINSLSVGNADIKGLVKTGPNGSIGIGPNGTVGDRAWVEGGNKGIQPGHSADDMNVAFPTVTLPGGIASYLPALNNPTNIGGVSYDYVFYGPGGNYSLDAVSDKRIYIAPNANVNLYIKGNVSLTGSSGIDISASGSLNIYMGGASFSTSGNAAINNMSQQAGNFTLFGLSSNTSISLGGNAAFTGAVYAPQADFTLGGGGSTTYDFVGASVSKTVSMNGHFNFHYDENLSRIGPGRGYIPTSWAEK